MGEEVHGRTSLPVVSLSCIFPKKFNAIKLERSTVENERKQTLNACSEGKEARRCE